MTPNEKISQNEPTPIAKTKCARCGVEILQSTAEGTNGLCMPCKKGIDQRPIPPMLIEVSCPVESLVSPLVIFVAAPEQVLEALEKAKAVGGPDHANWAELDAQRAVVRHAVKYRVSFRLNDDHWGRTGYCFIRLFEAGKAVMTLNEKQFCFADVRKEDWIGSNNQPLAGVGGFLYRDSTGSVIFKMETWIS